MAGKSVAEKQEQSVRQSVRLPMSEKRIERLELKIYRLQATIQRGLTEGVELDIALEQARQCRTGRAQARDVRQQLTRDFLYVGASQM